MKVMHISTANVSKIIIDMENITKYEVACWVSIRMFRFDLAYSKQYEGHFGCWNGVAKLF